MPDQPLETVINTETFSQKTRRWTASWLRGDPDSRGYSTPVEYHPGTGGKIACSVAGTIMKLTAPVSYPIIGSLPRRFRKRINAVAEAGGFEPSQYFQKYSNFLVDVVGGFGAAMYGGANDNKFLLYTGLYLGVQSFIKFMYVRGADYSNRRVWPGSLHNKLALLPLEVAIMIGEERKPKPGIPQELSSPRCGLGSGHLELGQPSGDS